MSLEGVVVESLDLSQLTDADLAGMLAAFRELALTRNRIALDLYAIVEKEMLSRHRSLEITDYTDDELNKAVACLSCAARWMRHAKAVLPMTTRASSSLSHDQRIA